MASTVYEREIGVVQSTTNQWELPDLWERSGSVEKFELNKSKTTQQSDGLRRVKDPGQKEQNKLGKLVYFLCPIFRFETQKFVGSIDIRIVTSCDAAKFSHSWRTRTNF